MTNSKLPKIADEAAARGYLAALTRSGMTLSEFARSKQLDGRSLRAWQINLSRRATAKSSRTRLVELVATPAATPTARYVVRVGDASVEIGDNFADDTLRRIVAVLRAC